MSITRGEIENLWSIPAYREWHEKWWAEDFSIDGCRVKAIATDVEEAVSFCGRWWDSFRLPLHSPDGVLNEAALTNRSELQSRLSQQHSGRAPFDARGVICTRPTAITANNGNIQLNASHAAFLGDFFLQNGVLAPVDIANCFVYGDARFESCRFEAFQAEHTFFNRAVAVTGKCLGRANFSRVRFNGALALVGHLEELSLEKATLAEELDLTPVLALRSLDAQRVKCSAGVKHTPSGRLWLQEMNHLNLSGAEIGSLDLSSNGATSGTVTCALVLDYAKVSSVSISQLALRELNARNLQVSGEFVIQNTTLTLFSAPGLEVEGADFQVRSSTIEEFDLSSQSKIKPMLLLHALSTLEVNLDDATLNGGALLEDFPRSGLVRGRKLHSLGSFSMPYLRTSRLDFSDAIFEQGFFAQARESEPGVLWSNFDNAIFKSPDGVCADFSGRKFDGMASFYGSTFAGIPQFHSVTFHEDLSFQAATFAPFDSKRRDDPLQNRRLARTEAAFRSLRKRMEEMRNGQDARRFHAFEMRARRRRTDKDVGLAERHSSWIYEHTSLYGDSIARPLACWILLFVLMTSAFLIWAASPEPDSFAHAASYSFQQVFRPFAVWDPRPTDDRWINGLLTPPAWWWWKASWALLIKIAASFHSIASLTLLFLFGLALRRRFQVS